MKPAHTVKITIQFVKLQNINQKGYLNHTSSNNDLNVSIEEACTIEGINCFNH